MDLNKLWVYDIETYPNVFTMYVGNANTRECWGFEISHRKDERSDTVALLRHIVKNKGAMVGFNNIGFDYPVVHYFLKNQNISVNEIYEKAMEIINSDDKFTNIISDKDTLIPQIDLYKIHHFDNKARSTSLKMLEFNMRSENIEDLPFEPGKVLTDEEIDVLLKYNRHDMVETYKFLMHSVEQIEFREKLSKQYNRNFINYNDTKIGKEYLTMKLEESNPGCCYVKTQHGRKPNQTIRNEIVLGECILPYIKFERPEFQAVFDWISGQVIKETKGVFTGILESDLGDVAKYAEMVTKKKKLKGKPTEKEIAEFKSERPMCWVEPVELKSGKTNYYLMWKEAENLNVVVDGLRYDYGTGGIHASIDSKIVRSDDEYIIIDKDVSSYYPNLSIRNRIYPEHLGETFCDIYEEIYNERKQYAKGTTENLMMKLALNGTYGASNDKYSPMYDPKFTMTITIGGQLSLSMLAEQLLKIPTLEMIQLNTDGLTYKVKREYEAEADKVCEEWEKITKLQLETAKYKLMAIRDVNSYISVTFEGKVKSKGAYQFDGFGWHQNQSAIVIPLAAKAAIVDGVDVEEFIMNHEDIYDFMLRTKVPRSSRLMAEVVDEDGYILEAYKLQNICRYYIANDGVRLTKVMPPINDKTIKLFEKDGKMMYSTTKTHENKLVRNGWNCIKEVAERRIGIDTGWLVKVCNNIKDFDGDINYDYYINEAKKLVDTLK